MLDRDMLSLLLADAAPAVSLYLPIDPGQRDTRAPAAALREALGEAESKIRAVADKARADALVGAMTDLVGDTDFTHHRESGLGLFVGGARPLLLSLPGALPRQVAVGPHFHIRPLLPWLALRQRFHVLALSAGRARLFAATPFSWEEIPLENVSTAVQAEIDSLPAGAEDAREDMAQQLLMEDLHRVEDAVKAKVGSDAAPILLVAEPEVGGHFRKLGHLPQLEPEMLVLNPHALAPSDLHRKALAAMAPHLESDLVAALEQANARLGTAEPTVSLRLEEILAAAEAARVETLVVAQAAPEGGQDDAVWGTFSLERGVSAHGTPGPGDEDLLNRAAVLSLRNGARVHAAPRERLPRQARAVATFRY